MQEFWNERYAQPVYAYGEQPNEWFKKQIDGMKPGKILLPGDGEGRNGVYAATLGWDVNAFDLSSTGKDKAIQLANKHTVEIDYKVGELTEFNYDKDSFDAIALIFTHFAPGLRTNYHQILSTYLKPGGVIIIEGFRKEQFERLKPGEKGGGPKNIDMLYSEAELLSDFKDFEILELKEEDVDLDEGHFHKGNNAVIRFLGRKKG